MYIVLTLYLAELSTCFLLTIDVRLNDKKVLNSEILVYR